MVGKIFKKVVKWEKNEITYTYILLFSVVQLFGSGAGFLLYFYGFVKSLFEHLSRGKDRLQVDFLN